MYFLLTNLLLYKQSHALRSLVHFGQRMWFQKAIISIALLIFYVLTKLKIFCLN